MDKIVFHKINVEMLCPLGLCPGPHSGTCKFLPSIPPPEKLFKSSTAPFPAACRFLLTTCAVSCLPNSQHLSASTVLDNDALYKSTYLLTLLCCHHCRRFIPSPHGHQSELALSIAAVRLSISLSVLCPQIGTVCFCFGYHRSLLRSPMQE